MTNDNLKAYIRSVLLTHVGKTRAITGRELASIVGERDDRQVRLVIRELIGKGLPIASSTEAPQGYFVVDTRQEADDYAASIRSRLIENALRRRDFRRAADMYLTPAQQGQLL